MILRLAPLVLVVLAPSLSAQATYWTYLQSCRGAIATPQLTAGAPVVTGPWVLTVTGLSPSTPGALVFALGDIGGGLELGSFGAPGCFVNVDIFAAAGSFSHSATSDVAGLMTFAAVFPDVPGLLGFTFYNQYVSLEAPAGRPLPITTTNAGIGVVGVPGVRNMVPIAAGTFQMGSNDPHLSNPAERPVHTVHITRPFWIGKYEVTQAEYLALMGRNPSSFVGPNRPVETVHWDDAMTYCAVLTAQERAAGRLPAGYQYRLPTEAEWEYCCRAGTTTEWNTGSGGLSCPQANFSVRVMPWWEMRHCVGRTSVVGSYAPNPWGLHDMHGNVIEWCLDAWDLSANYPAGPVDDPYVSTGIGRIVRGGAWFDESIVCRSASRSWRPVPPLPGGGGDGDGFRVVLAPILVNHP
ncbi:MAG: formylglycine-generating enzyme family protein [Planctomycetes bacterium]|nr:formylglycine-generating enzyme family protein [Planctomycetota bacterium]